MKNQMKPTWHSTEPERKDTGKSCLSKSASLFKGAVMLLTLMIAGFGAFATPIPTTSLSCTQATTATTSCVSGFFASGWTSGTGYWTYTLNTTGYTAISMTFNEQRSGTGPSTAIVAYNIGAGDVNFTSFTTGTSCTSHTLTLPAACEGVSGLVIKFKMSGATNAGGTHRMPSNGGFNGTSAGCSAAVAGTISAGTSAFCGSGATVLTLTGATAGTGISYAWENSTDGGATWSTITGATNYTYTTPVISTTTLYRATVTCSAGPTSATTSPATITINSLPSVAAINELDSTILINTTLALTDGTSGGTWTSSNTGAATIDALSGIATAVYGGTTTISYTVTGGNGCINSATGSLNVVWPNTLALYAGVNGTSTATIAGQAHETALPLVATGFGSASACGSGGLSGLTVPVSITSYDAANPHVGYKVGAEAGSVLNAFRIHAITRESSTGPSKARIAYRSLSHAPGSSWTGWIVDSAYNQSTGGSCGANSNSWDFGTTTGGGLTLTGIDSIEVAVYPYAPGASTGTFQLNTLEIYGKVTPATDCYGTSVSAGAVTPSKVYICDSGSYWLTFDGAYQGAAGYGIQYQWNANGTPIAGATNASYNTTTLSAYPSNQVINYTVTVSCSLGGPSTTSAEDTVYVTKKPSAGTAYIYGNGPSGVTNYGDSVVLINSPLGLGVAGTLFDETPGGYLWFSSNDTSAISVDSAFGDLTPHIPGVATITVHNVVNGCTGIAKANAYAIYDSTVVAYLGVNGNSNAVANYQPAAVSATTVTQTGYTPASSCSLGGISGLTTSVNAFSAGGPRVSFTLTNTSLNPVTIKGFHATLRKSGSGPENLVMAYTYYGASTTFVSEAAPHLVETDACGYSTVDKVFGEFGTETLPTLAAGESIEFDLYGFLGIGGLSTGTLQVNTFDIVASSPGNGFKYIGQNALSTANSNIAIYPNPASTTLNIAAGEDVNVSVMSVDGKTLIQQNNTKSVDVSNLASGLYMIKLYNQSNGLIKTVSFTKL